MQKDTQPQQRLCASLYGLSWYYNNTYKNVNLDILKNNSKIFSEYLKILDKSLTML